MNWPAPPSPREWLQEEPFPWPPTHSLPDGSAVRACFCVVEVQLARTRNDQPYLRLTLSDRHGSLEGRVWDGAEELATGLRQGGYIGVQGHVEFFNGQLQLCVEDLTPLAVELADLELFLPRSDRPGQAMAAELESFIASIQDGPLRELLRALLGADTEVGRGFRLAPAAKHNHHAYLGGLLEHTLSVTQVCERLADHYGAAIDRDLLIAAALLHDVGKVREIGARAGFPYTDEGKLLGHILLGLQMVDTAARSLPAIDPARLLLLRHLIASHQGRFEWQSPREPSILEAILLHYADDLDAKLQQVRELMARANGPWTPYDRGFRREFLRHSLPADAGLAAESGEARPAPAAPSPHLQALEQDVLTATDGPPESAAATIADSTVRRLQRGPRSHGGNSFQRMSEDTLDLFGAQPDD